MFKAGAGFIKALLAVLFILLLLFLLPSLDTKEPSWMNDDPNNSDIQIQSYLVENYRDYLKEAALVVSKYYMGENLDLSAMQVTKEKLF